MAKIRCAIYVRKSTEFGLEQEFNSLNNQEEACRSYIAAQSFNGWEYTKTYTDAAISGGTTERPALKQMLHDMSRGLIQIVVVYKVDRLSRSILDFHNMMTEFDKYNCSFVSITQSFDTSTSMGKLILNVLLSFAQFEREVSSERVRDKIRATRAKGMWTGGVPWIGYDVVDKKLVINPAEAAQVQTIFEMYLQIGSVIELGKWLRDNGIFNKKWTTANGETRGGNKISVMSLHRILREKIYTGQIEHKKNGTAVKGEHDAIISQELFDAVQEKLRESSNGKSGRSNGSPNLLSGKIYNASGTKFTNQKANKSKGERNYYSSRGFYLPAGDIDKLATETVHEFLDSDTGTLPLG
jgi:DNA invertase Pin-like site-specific DNA recombinase